MKNRDDKALTFSGYHTEVSGSPEMEIVQSNIDGAGIQWFGRLGHFHADRALAVEPTGEPAEEAARDVLDEHDGRREAGWKG